MHVGVLEKPFIAVYHGVKKIGELPKKIFSKTENAALKVQDAQSLKQAEIESTVPTEKKKKKPFFIKGRKKVNKF